MLEALDFEVDVQGWPFDGAAAAHANVQDMADAGNSHPRDAVVGEEIVLTADAEQDAVGINHQYACRCARSIVLETVAALAMKNRTHNWVL